MHFFDEKVRAIMVNFDEAGHDAFMLGLIQLYLWDSIKKQLDILPSWTVNLLCKDERKDSDILLASQLE
jgi:hypothetical protein